MKHNTLLWVLLWILIPFAAHSQQLPLDSLQSRLNAYIREHPVNGLYVHMDRNEYAVDDTIWFKAYMLTPMSNEVLFVRITDSDKRIVLEKQFPVRDIRSNGEIAIPDDFMEGEYRFVAYMDRMINFDPDNVFVQPFNVSKNTAKKLSIEAFVSDVNKLKIGSKVEILLKLNAEDFDKAVRGSYTLNVGNRQIKSGVISTNSQGEAHIHFEYPSVSDYQSVRCEVTMNYLKESAKIMLNLRHEGNSVNLNFYPEGGHLISGVANTLVVVARDDSKSPVAAKLMLMDGLDVVGTTTTNQSGMGEWSFVPREGAEYSVKVMDNGTTKTQKLPCVIEQSGFALQLVVGEDKTTAQITNADKDAPVRVLLRSFERIVWSDSLYLKKGQMHALELPLRNLPAGILSFLVCDQTGAPRAERVFMNKNTQEYVVDVATKKKVEKGVQSIGVNIDIADKMGNPVLANLSVAVVEKSTLNLNEYRTILQSHYFHSLLKPNGRNFDEKALGFDTQLKASNWIDFQWDSIYQYRSTGPLQILANTGGMNFVVRSLVTDPVFPPLAYKTRSWSNRNPLLDHSVLLDTLRITPSRHNRKTNLFPKIERVDSVKLDGSLVVFTPKMLLANGNEDKYFELNQSFFTTNTLQEFDLNADFEKLVTKSISLDYSRPFNTYTKYTAPPVKTMNRAIQLREVEVNGKGNSSLRLCDLIGDYYCLNKVINCPNHSEIEGRPSIGTAYSCEISENYNVLIDYNGPDKPFTNSPKGIPVNTRHYYPLHAIHQPRTFFEPSTNDSTFFVDDIRSTVYWNPNLNTLTKGKASFNFNLSTNRSSEFIVVIQGIDVETFKPIFYTYKLKL